MGISMRQSNLLLWRRGILVHKTHVGLQGRGKAAHNLQCAGSCMLARPQVSVHCTLLPDVCVHACVHVACLLRGTVCPQ